MKSRRKVNCSLEMGRVKGREVAGWEETRLARKGEEEARMSLWQATCNKNIKETHFWQIGEMLYMESVDSFLSHLLAFSPKILARKCYHVTILGGQGDIRVVAAGKQSLVRGTDVAFKFAPLKEKLLGLDHPFLKCFTPLSSSSSG